MTQPNTVAAPQPYRPTRTVLVLGASYGGYRAIQMLLPSLPKGWRVVVLERNTHANHLYAFPRVAVVKGHEHKVFIPYTKMFAPGGQEYEGSHVLLHGCLISLAQTAPPENSTKLRYGRGVARYLPLTGGATCCRAPNAASEMMEVRFDYMIYALGSHLPPCINVWSGPGPMPATQGAQLMQPGQCCRIQPPANRQEQSAGLALPLARRPATAAALQVEDAPPTPLESSVDPKNVTRTGNASGADVATQLEASLTLEASKREMRPPTPPDSRQGSPPGTRCDDSQPQTGSGTSTGDVNINVKAGIASTLPPCRGSKKEGMAWLRDAQERICKSDSVLVIGGGALGVQFATDIAAVYGTPSVPRSSTPKRVTLVSSSAQLLPRFDSFMHEESMRKLEEMGVDVLLGARANLESLEVLESGKRVLSTLDGRLVDADLVLFCTGQRPNTSFLASLANKSGMPNIIDERSGMAMVSRSLQLGARPSGEEEEPVTLPEMEHIFVIGDAADAFGALNAGHTAWYQAELAVRNICKLIERDAAAEAEQKNVELDRYEPPTPNIKVSLGLDCAIFQSGGKFGYKGLEDCTEDLNTPSMWTRRGLSQDDMMI